LRSIESAPANWTTTAGTFKSTEQTQYQRILPDLHEVRTQYVVINMLLLGIYDLILGRDLLMNLGIILNFNTQMVEWDDMEIPMKPENSTC
jgi:hypothetical protein